MSLKRAFDIVVAGAVLVASLPILCAVAFAVAFDDGLPVLFRQERVGRNGRHFWIHKFRTMSNSRGGPNISAAGDDRITAVGRVLRKSKLDELPQLFDVLRGAMSLVGPRPEVPEYVAQWPPGSRSLILSVRPGMTDPVSIRFRNEADLLSSVADPVAYYESVLLPAKVEGYINHVRSRTFLGDLAILARTFIAIVRS